MAKAFRAGLQRMTQCGVERRRTVGMIALAGARTFNRAGR